jgi:hypothetical protein
MKTKQISIRLPSKIIIDFRCYAGGKRKAVNLLKDWVKEYVDRLNKEDLALLESHKKIRDSLTNK